MQDVFNISDANDRVRLKDMPRMKLAKVHPKSPKKPLYYTLQSNSTDAMLKCCLNSSDPVSKTSPILTAIAKDNLSKVSPFMKPFPGPSSSNSVFEPETPSTPIKKKRPSPGVSEWMQFFKFQEVYFSPFHVPIGIALNLYRVYGDTENFRRHIRKELYYVTKQEYIGSDEFLPALETLLQEKDSLLKKELALQKELLNKQK